MTTSPTITYTLEEFLMRFEQKIDRHFSELRIDLKQEIANLGAEIKQEIAKLDQKADRQYAELKQDVKELNQKIPSLSEDVKTLGEKVAGVENTVSSKMQGIEKHLENLAFILRSLLIAFFTGFVGLILKVLGVIPNIKTS